LGKVYEYKHPLIYHKLAFIRKKETGPKEFRELVKEVSLLMVYEITKDMPLKDAKIDTPITSSLNVKLLAGKKIVLVPVLRAGLGMLEGILAVMPTAKVGHIGLYRDPKTKEAARYYSKLPSDLAKRQVIVIEPMLATGGSAVEAISLLKENGAVNLKLMCLISSKEGILKVQNEFSDVDIYTAAIDEELNVDKYIVPGLGDAGDRLFGT